MYGLTSRTTSPWLKVQHWQLVGHRMQKVVCCVKVIYCPNLLIKTQCSVITMSLYLHLSYSHNRFTWGHLFLRHVRVNNVKRLPIRCHSGQVSWILSWNAVKKSFPKSKRKLLQTYAITENNKIYAYIYIFTKNKTKTVILEKKQQKKQPKKKQKHDIILLPEAHRYRKDCLERRMCDKIQNDHWRWITEPAGGLIVITIATEYKKKSFQSVCNRYLKKKKKKITFLSSYFPDNLKDGWMGGGVTYDL